MLRALLVFFPLLVLIAPAMADHIPPRVAYGSATLGPLEFDALLLWTASGTGAGHFLLQLTDANGLVQHRIVFAGQEIIATQGDGCLVEVDYTGESALEPDAFFRVAGSGPVDVCGAATLAVEGHYLNAWHLEVVWQKFDPRA